VRGLAQHDCRGAFHADGRVDLAAWSAGRLHALGVGAQRVRVLRGCTACSPGTTRTGATAPPPAGSGARSFSGRGSASPPLTPCLVEPGGSALLLSSTAWCLSFAPRARSGRSGRASSPALRLAGACDRAGTSRAGAPRRSHEAAPATPRRGTPARARKGRCHGSCGPRGGSHPRTPVRCSPA
jgi:hypothetical protein